MFSEEDAHIWLEDIDAEKCIDWAKAKNEETFTAFGQPEKDARYEKILKVLDSKDKIASVVKTGDFYYNFWQDADHVRGIWRRCSLEEYKKPPAEVQWELVLDIDALGKEEGESWVWHGKVVLDEGPDVEPELCLVRLSPGGSDADAVREFNLKTKQFVPESEGGFRIGTCKSDVGYHSRDVLLVGTDTGADGDMTDSGYPKRSREWKRGTPLSEAKVVYECEKTDIACSAFRYYDRGVWHERRHRAITFYTSEEYFLHQGEWKKVDIPDDLSVSTFRDSFLFTLRSEWKLGETTYSQGALLAIPIDKFFAGDLNSMKVLFSPTESQSLEDTTGTLNFLVLSVLDDVKTKLLIWEYDAGSGSWKDRGAETGCGMETVSLRAVESDKNDDIWADIQGYIRPTSLFLSSVSDLIEGKLMSATAIKMLPALFNADNLQVEQFFATSMDGTKIPYFQVSKKDLKLDGSNVTLLYGYGGFEISLTPVYAGARGVAWLEEGGVWIDANIRGGGEYGPRWHQAAKKANRNKAYEDFEAVAADLISRGVTSREKLGTQGGSNGGLLMGNMLTRRGHELFGAVVCQVPLLDMKRFSKLLAGASWMGEYGDPDTDDWSNFLHKYSPYQKVSDSEKYPPTLFTTSTKDDRVHPGHARKMVAKMCAHPTAASTTFYYENIEGGHGGAADNKQRAFMKTVEFAFLWKTLNGAA
eukprot:TRINITY_DN21177_c0_g1_i1.p1 TRINITY_DN21177_c0_g1~~TRINITY_DN21177_c0_g1_i1.p1  ORF type:complete len:700 (+),score=138.49 TRINITY_DN21177_c0_g1_i1:101-2200(+)